MTRYIKNERGAVHSVDDEHFDTYLTTRTNDGGRFTIPGVTEITEDEARELNPQLFGAPDPQISFTDDELGTQIQRKRMLDELFGPKGA